MRGSASSWGRRRLRCAALAAAALAALACLAVAPVGAGAQPTTAPARVLDGPSAGIDSLNGISIARDGSGGLVYLKDVGGVAHVFVSRLLGGVFQIPQQVDAGLAGPSSQPVIAAASGGLLLVAFINGGQLLEVSSTGAAQPLSAPTDLFNGASNPAISITTLGKAYLAFTAAGDGGHDVRCFYYYQGQWSLEAAALDAVSSDDAGTGSGRPAVTAAQDGVGIVAWGEAGHVYVRRVWAASPSIEYLQADVPSLSGWNEVSADQPAIDSAGDSSYAAIAFREVLSNGTQQQSRVLMQRLQAEDLDGLVQVDGLTTPGPEGADQPQVAVGEYGEGLLTSARTISDQLVAARLNANESPAGLQQIDSLQNTGLPFAVPAAVGYHSAVIAWQQNPGLLGGAEIRARFFDGTSFGPEQVLSSAAMGAAQASQGLVAAGDIAANVAVAWVQGSGSSTAIVTAQMYQPPGSFGATSVSPYLRTTQPVLSWSAAHGAWGPLVYVVRLDGAVVAQTGATSVAIPNATYPFPLTQGPHIWQVTVTNPAGLTRTDKAAKIFVDTIPPVVTVRITGKRRVGSAIHVKVSAIDAPPPLPKPDASGVAKVSVKFGDGANYVIRHGGKYHVYHRAKTYKVTITVTDRAGNTTKIMKKIKITAKKRKGHAHG
jgi:hypothetical protein